MPRAGGFAAFQKKVQQEEAAAPAGPAPIGAEALRRSAKPIKTLNLEETKALLEALRSAVIHADFQNALSNLRARDWGAFKKRNAVAKLLAMAWKAPIKDFGFGIDAIGFPQVLSVVRTHQTQPGIRTLSEEVERTLKFFPGALFGSKAGEMKQSEVHKDGGAFSKAAGAPPVAPEPPAGPTVRDRPVNLGEAKEMLKSFKEILTTEEFRRTLENMRKRGELQFRRLMPAFLAQAWSQTLVFFDFPATEKGFKEVLTGISKHGWNHHVKLQAHELERMLLSPKGSIFLIPGDPGEEEPAPSFPAPGPDADAPLSSFAPPKRGPGPDDVELEIAHAVHGTTISVYVNKDATFWDVKEAIAALVGRDEILNKGKLVRRSDTSDLWTAYKNSERIGKLRYLQVLGADLTLPEEPERGGPPGSVAAEERFTQMNQPTLTLDSALNLQRDLHAGFASPDFQNKLTELQVQFGGTSKYIKERSELVLSVQKLVLPQYGFQPSHRGVFDMMEAFALLGDIPALAPMGMEINKLLQLDKPNVAVKPEDPRSRQPELLVASRREALAAAGLDDTEATQPKPEPKNVPPKPPPPPPREVELTVRHATREQDEIKLKVMTNWTLQQVKDALASVVTHDNIRGKAKFVYRVDARDSWKNLEDKALVGDQSVLNCMGVDCLNLVDREIDVTITHAINGGTPASLTVRTTYTFKDVKDVLASRTGSEEVRKSGRFVFRPGRDASWMSYRETEQVGERNKLHLLGCDLPALKPETAKEVEVTVKHAKTQAFVQVTVLSTATMLEVREAVARLLGRKDVLSEGKLVQPQGHAPYRDSDLLGKRRRLLFLGPDLALEAAEQPVAEEPAAEPEPAAFTLEDACRLLASISAACTRPDIQERASDPLLVGETFMEACAGPAAEFGFGHDEDALRKMFSAVKNFTSDATVQDHLQAIEQSLQLPPGGVVSIADSMMVAF